MKIIILTDRKAADNICLTQWRVKWFPDSYEHSTSHQSPTSWRWYIDSFHLMAVSLCAINTQINTGPNSFSKAKSAIEPNNKTLWIEIEE